ncbi:cytochrome c oxidase subunit 7A2, mitochondrial-like [Diorhabda carinulata]|uniref:cytochrome c oxidase subunit 7A2, mitochondrial-like n=1 Tax=Diorhabda sublineata TaxID=1163346 RepID=UPI0024E0C09D|nr:cytochrome c oxidase subunit 7A2, mitochondrial-like [Diorhabda sublineata]XP_057653989.1 cytochrome c oxidase subunit 7A2, mitochondrial-like [Diorhabda carinulata]
MNHARQVWALSRAISNQVVRNASTEVGPRTARLKELQKKLQVDDGVPVHLKAGLGDKLLYQFTALLTLVGVGMSFETLYRIITGKK